MAKTAAATEGTTPSPKKDSVSDGGVEQADVMVVGAGPAGLVAAITLALYGVTVLLVEKRRRISTLSRALVISTRSMEILRAWGLEEAVRSGAAEVEPCAWVARTLASPEGTTMQLGYPSDPEAATISPTRPAWAPQDHLEPVLLAHLRAATSVKLCFGTELVGLRQADGGICALLRESGSGSTKWIETQFVVGADGAHSTVRRLLGIEMEGPDALADYQSIHFQASLAPVIAHRRYGLYVITHPDAAGVLASRGPHGRWAFSREWKPGQASLADCSADQLAALIGTAVGDRELQPRIERVSTFLFAAQIAGRYQERRGFLVGDAAHRMTPRGGTGMNTAIQDAHDVAWKLGWVLRGWASKDLLSTHEADRRPVGLHNVTRSGDPNGARQQAAEALAWDLYGRLPHHWLQCRDRTLSTLDLLGDGLTLLADAAQPRWRQAESLLDARAPVSTHVLAQPVARTIGVPPGGALLLRPDGREVTRWASFGELTQTGPHAEWWRKNQ